MRPEEYLKIVLRRWWLIPLIALVAAAVAFWYTDRQPRVYNSSTTMQVTGEPLGYWIDLTAKNQLAPLKPFITSGEIAQRAVERGGLGQFGLDAGAVQSRLAVAHNPDTNTIQIAASDSDPRRAAAIVNAVAGAFVEWSEANNRELAESFPRRNQAGDPVDGAIDRVRVRQLAPATPQLTPSAPRPKLNAAAAAILGVALALVLAFALEYLDDTLRSAEDVRRHLDLPVLSGIPGGGGPALGARLRGGGASGRQAARDGRPTAISRAGDARRRVTEQ